MFDPDPIKDRVIRNIVNAGKRSQFEASIKYAKLAKVDTDPNIIEVDISLGRWSTVEALKRLRVPSAEIRPRL